MKRTNLILLCLLASQAAFGQCPDNLDFERANFANWQLSIGSAGISSANENVLILTPVPEPYAGRHQIISDPDAKDPYGGFPMLCPFGGGYSMKLGNDQTGAEAEGISYTFKVPALADTFTFNFFYAVVFEDPGHALPEQPRFFATAYDVLTGELIDCASYDFVATSNLPGFKESPQNAGVLYKEWSPVSIQFVNKANRDVRLEFKTGDCTLGGHFGYAYVDVGTNCSNILATAPYCLGTNSVILNAPYGFESYTWWNSDFTEIMGTGQSVTLSPPPATTTDFHVDMNPYVGFGCRDTAFAYVQPMPTPEIPIAEAEVFYCQQEPPRRLEAKSEPGHLLLWYLTETGGLPLNESPAPSTSSPGTTDYYVSQKALFGCESPRRKISVHVLPMPIVSFNINQARQCESGNVFEVTSTSTNLADSKYLWDFGDGNSLSDASTSASHSFTRPGNFDITLRITNAPSCTKELRTRVTVVPKPVAVFSFPELICERQTPIAILDQAYVPDNLGVINQQWWSVDGTVYMQTPPPGFQSLRAGAIQVRQAVSTTEGCYSDTLTRTMMVRAKPQSKFRYEGLACENEVIRFLDQSTIPGSPGNESVTQWNWFVDQARTSGSQNPGLRLTPGSHNISLHAVSNYGCIGDTTETVLQVYEKPLVDASITDSCVKVYIRFEGIDRLNTVSKWNWDFPQNVSRSIQGFSRIFPVEGDHSFSLLGTTVNGCKDTLLRQYRIYGNRSLAGRDTITAMDEPVQLNAGGGSTISYTWTPATGLNNPAVENPVATLDVHQRYHLYSISDKGCVSESDILIQRYKGPELFFPSAFSPNGDGLNDQFGVFPVGISKFISTSIYNRHGQLVFYATDPHKQWDGRIAGADQGSDNFVVVVQAIDYKGRPMLRKGNLLLIR